MKLGFINLVTVAAPLVGLGVAQPPNQPTRQVAIIGAGAAGSSAAYHVQKFASQAGIHVNLTLFEKTDHIGGRTLTINPFDDPAQPVELGASIFVQANRILYGSLAEFGLSPRDPDAGSDPILGVWDGECFVFTIDQSQPSWWNTLKVIMRYGLTAPRRTQQLTAATVAKFLRIYDAPFFPFRSLTQRAQELELVEVTGVTGEQFLRSNNVDDLYAHDLVQAGTRVNYASNLANLHGLVTMVSLVAEDALAVQGGNWQIFQKMAQRSGAFIALNTTVVALDKSQMAASSRPQYTIHTASASTPDNAIPHRVAFDNIIIANPFQFSGISAAEGVLQTAIDEIPYVHLHVTIFTSPSLVKPQAFGLTTSQRVPGTVLTTLAKTDSPTSGVDGLGKAGFFSLSTLGKAVNPSTQQQEYVYKIFSPEKVTVEFLRRLFGDTVPETFTGEGSPISWYYPHVFNSYPKSFPRVTFQEPIVGQGVYYTSGIEGFISTMETSALMGKNVARLLVDDILANTSGGDSVRDDVAWEDEQRVLGLG